MLKQAHKATREEKEKSPRFFLSCYSGSFYTMDKALLKDGILRVLLDNKNRNNRIKTEYIANELQITNARCNSLIIQICKDGYIHTTAFAVHGEFRQDYICRIRPEGEDFLISDGGYTSLERKRKNSNAWKITQNAIIAITAIGTLLVSISQCTISNKTNELQKQIDTLNAK